VRQPFRVPGRIHDVTAPDDFVDRFPELFGVAYRASYPVLGSREEADDCAQEALARLLSRFRTVPDHAVVPWVARVATNLAIDRWRKLDRVRKRQPIAITPTPLDGRRGDLVRALRSLPDRQREAIVLRHLLDLSERDTAAALGCTTGSVKSATSRGLDRLRELLGPEWALD
jgi:RNA polymerase sigma factor (sigma-70 family)